MSSSTSDSSFDKESTDQPTLQGLRTPAGRASDVATDQAVLRRGSDILAEVAAE